MGSKETIVYPFLFDGKMILVFDEKCIRAFGKIPSFLVFVDDDKKLHLVSEEVIN